MSENLITAEQARGLRDKLLEIEAEPIFYAATAATYAPNLTQTVIAQAAQIKRLQAAVRVAIADPRRCK